MFLMLSALLIISNNNLALYKEENRESFFGLYFSWLDQVYTNVYTITGKIIEMKWIPDK